MNRYFGLMIATTATALLLSGCASATKMEKRALAESMKPIPVDGSKDVGFRRIVFKVPAGAKIGWHHDGLARIRHYSHHWDSGVFFGSDQFKIAAAEQLRNMGYSVLGNESLVFGEDNSGKARYQLGCTVTSLEYNSCAPLAGNFCEANIQVEWQVLDSLRNSVVYSSSTAGYGKQGGTNYGVMLIAFRNAIDHLMAKNEFVSALQKDKETDELPKYADKLPVFVKGLDQAKLNLPEGIESVMDGVLIIKTGAALGSGFIISKDGFALTAAHVVSGVKEVAVKLHSGLELEAKVVRIDEAQDIALIKLSGRGFTPIPIMVEGTQAVGTELYAIGAPKSEQLAFSVTKGIVSGHREQSGIKYLQTDASINSGNSGGPLLSKSGAVVAIVSCKIVALSVEGLSFGVPVQVVGSRLGIEWKTNETGK